MMCHSWTLTAVYSLALLDDGHYYLTYCYDIVFTAETTRQRDWGQIIPEKKILHEQYLFLKLYAINQTSDFNHVLLFMYICFGTFRILLTSRVSELFCFSVERTGMDFERNSMRIWPYNLVDKVSIFVPSVLPKKQQ